MTLRFSDGADDSLLAKIKADFDGGFIDVYAGPPPATPNLAPIGTLLGTFSKDGDGITGLTFAAPAGNVLAKSATETWKMTGLAVGTAGWFRLRTASDTGAESSTEKRIDGLVARTGGDLNMTSTTVAVGSPHTLDVFNLSPAA